MTTPERIKEILRLPFSSISQSTSAERALFSEKKEGLFYTFSFPSGQRFVAHLPRKEKVYTFRPYRNFLPELIEFQWRRKTSISDLGYTVTCHFTPGTPAKIKAVYDEIFRPVPDNSPNKPLTKIAFQYYYYHPLLEKCYWLQYFNAKLQDEKQAVCTTQNRINELLTSMNKNQHVKQ